MPEKSLVIDVAEQKARLYEGPRLMEVFNVSTAKNGLGDVPDSGCTPAGELRVSEKFGAGAPLHAIFKDRVQTGVWDGRETEANPILTRILWLEGAEPSNSHTKERYIYLHGTSHEGKLGTPNSEGCIVFAPRDIVRVFDALEVGDKVVVVPPPSRQGPQP